MNVDLHLDSLKVKKKKKLIKGIHTMYMFILDMESSCLFDKISQEV